MLKTNYVLLLVFFFLFIQLRAQYKIEIQVKPLVNTDVFLGYHYGNEQFVIDTCRLDDSGKGVFNGKKKLHEGVYMIVLPGMTYFDILIDSGQKFAVSNDTADLSSNLVITGSEQNQVYIKYQNFISAKRKEKNSVTAMARINSRQAMAKLSKDSSIYYKKKIEDIDSQIINERNRIIKTYPGTFFARLLTAMSEPEIPDEYSTEPIEEKINYFSRHYFDNYDFSDESLLYSPVLYNKITNYFGEIVILEPDSVNNAIDRILMKSMQTPDVYRYIADLMMNLFDISGNLTNDEAFVYLARNYYLNDLAPWANQLFLSKLESHIRDLSPTLAGSPAPLLSLMTTDGRQISLQDQNSCFTLVVFWNPDCEFCMEYINQLIEIKKDLTDDFFNVYAVFAGDKPDAWKSFTGKNTMNWINVYDPSGKNEFIETYNLYTSPRVFLLDKTKKIIRKDIAIELLLMFLEKQNKNNCK